MSASYNGYAFKVMTRDVNSPGGWKTRQLLVVARSMQEASEMAQHMKPGAIFEGSNPEILAKAALGIRNGEAGIDDGQSS